jgi:predicted DNA-binding transcriptional regulator AlpA
MKVTIRDISIRIQQSGLKKSFIYEKMGVSKKTFYSRMIDKEFKPSEVIVLQQLGII